MELLETFLRGIVFGLGLLVVWGLFFILFFKFGSKKITKMITGIWQPWAQPPKVWQSKPPQTPPGRVAKATEEETKELEEAFKEE